MSFINENKSIFQALTFSVSNSGNNQEKIKTTQFAPQNQIAYDEFVTNKNIDEVAENWAKQQTGISQNGNSVLNKLTNGIKKVVDFFGSVTAKIKDTISNLFGKKTAENKENQQKINVLENVKASQINELVSIVGKGDKTIKLYDKMSNATSFSDFNSISKNVKENCSKNMSYAEKEIRSDIEMTSLNIATFNMLENSENEKAKLMNSPFFPKTLKEDLFPLYDKLADAVDQNQKDKIQAEIAWKMNEAKQNGIYTNKLGKINEEISFYCTNISNAKKLEAMFNKRDLAADEAQQERIDAEIKFVVNNFVQEEQAQM